MHQRHAIHRLAIAIMIDPPVMAAIVRGSTVDLLSFSCTAEETGGKSSFDGLSVGLGPKKWVGFAVTITGDEVGAFDGSLVASGGCGCLGPIVGLKDGASDGTWLRLLVGD